MPELSGYAYSEVEFDENGTGNNQVEVAAQITDLFIMSHGWRNDAGDARKLYSDLFASIQAVSGSFACDASKMAVLGVFWPSEAFDEDLASPAAAQAFVQKSQAAGVSVPGAAARLTAIEKKLEALKEFFTEPGQQQALQDAKGLAASLENHTDARAEFVRKVRSLFAAQGAPPPPEARAQDMDGSPDFFTRDPSEIMDDLRTVDEDDEVPAPAGHGTGHATGLADLWNDFKSSALRLLNYATYFEMKRRAGNVGQYGVAPLINQLAGAHGGLQRIHLIGHSFGGRVVTAAAAHAQTPKLKSMTLLQAAFSHNGFSDRMKGFFRNVVDDKKVSGPVLITYSSLDQANGIAYPIASRLSRDKASGFGDKTDVFGAIGHNGAQQMTNTQAVEGTLQDVSKAASYDFSDPVLYNLNGEAFIKAHGDVTGQQIAAALLSALFPRKS